MIDREKKCFLFDYCPYLTGVCSVYGPDEGCYVYRVFKEIIDEDIEMIRDDMKKHHDYLSGKYRKALSMAISALQAQETCEDTISRQAAIDALNEYSNNETTSTEKAVGVDYCVDIIQKLPFAQPERKKGKWIVRETACGDVEARCSCCGFSTLVNEPGNGLHMIDDLNFCPNCGADMRGDSNGSN